MDYVVGSSANKPSGWTKAARRDDKHVRVGFRRASTLQRLESRARARVLSTLLILELLELYSEYGIYVIEQFGGPSGVGVGITSGARRRALDERGTPATPRHGRIAAGSEGAL
ncbi:hypothetical protein MSG28_010336 [Choristoneura fumiferana]|uniref:Uncharacterized protein n=1 Tax=Choristoneura fumiferana TaxID=7141 RepID=A0ACC0KLA2_CHOFU|nr:hypothetical protein MSG28_010336 [Choristoneura fumiferana]